MSGAINTKHFVQHMSGGVHGASAGLCAWLSGSGSRDVVGPTFTNPLPAPAAPENTGNDLTYRAYHRSISLHNTVDGVGLYLYHQDRIWHNDAPPSWSTAHIVGGQNTTRDSGDHTGLYPVHSQDGSRLYVCAFYRTTTNTIGWVRWDTLANAWSSGDSTLGSHTTVFGPCVQWQNYLVHAGSSGLIFFNPENLETIIVNYSGDLRDWIHVSRGRLFVISRNGTTSLHLLEFVYGGLIDHGAFTGTENGTTEGGWSTWNFSDVVFYVPYYSSSGGQGFRLEKIAVGGDIRGASDITFSDLTNPVIPDGMGPDTPGNYRWPTAGVTNGRQMWLSAIDAAEWPRGAFGTAGGTFSGFHLQAFGAGSNKFAVAHLNLGWNGEGARVTTVSFPDPFTTMNGRYSYPVSRYGRGLTDLNGGGGAWIESIEPYNDGTISRGLLIKWREKAYSGARDVQIQFGYPTGFRTGPGFDTATLSVGDGIDLGGTAVLNGARNSVDEYIAAYHPGGGLPQAVLDYDIPSLGPGFTVGETITGSFTATTATVLAVNATTRRLSVQLTGGGGTGGPEFTSSDEITGSTSGTVAQLSSGQDVNPLYQVIWDLDTDMVPDFASVELSLVSIAAGVSTPAGNFGGYIVGPTQIVLIPESQASTISTTEVAGPSQQIQTLSDNNALEVAGPSQQIIALSDNNASNVAGPSQQIIVQSDMNAVEVSGPTQQIIVQSDMNAVEVSGPAQEITAETNLIADTMSQIPNRPLDKPDGTMSFQLDGVEQTTQEELNFDNTGSPWHTLEFETALPNGPSIEFNIDSITELGRVSFDAVVDLAGTTKSVLDVFATNGLDSATLSSIVVVATGVSGVSVQPTVSVGTNNPAYDNQLTAMLNLTATNQSEAIPASIVSKVARNETIFVQLDSQATAGAYTFDIILYGYQTLV